MANSGVTVSKACKDEFEKLKMGREYRYIVYRLSDDLKEVIVEKTAAPDASYDDLCDDLRQARDMKQCRYAVFTARYKKGDANRAKIVFFMWTPSESTMKQKMLYAASKGVAKDLGEGIQLNIQMDDDDDMKWEEVEKKLLDNDKYF